MEGFHACDYVHGYFAEAFIQLSFVIKTYFMFMGALHFSFLFK